MKVRLPISASSIPHRHPAPQKEWECPFCGSVFDGEWTKDIHMNSCKRKSLNIQQQQQQQQHDTACLPAQTQPKCPQPTKSEYSIFLYMRLQQNNENIVYISETNEQYSLVWNSSKFQYTGHAVLSPGLHTGRIHFRTSNRFSKVKSFQVSPSTNDIEILIQDPPVDNVTTRKPVKNIARSTKQVLNSPPSQPAEPVKSSYDDGQIYANISKSADNIRLQYAVDHYKEKVTKLEGENFKLTEENAKMKDIIDSFHIKMRELESEVTRLSVLESKSNVSKDKPQITPPPVSPRPDIYQTSVKQRKS
ncbi:hypothetical protein LOD99_10651 [Oopsacas minuta]|uniref:Uncharacterized protein n=1 Tax=Oopsacas minuta TaxID=111878 RepID=A0AAV7KFB0_9METZ|nr:hypothetical protein LOD99_10651 [Oopsacas minuta]